MKSPEAQYSTKAEAVHSLYLRSDPEQNGPSVAQSCLAYQKIQEVREVATS